MAVKFSPETVAAAVNECKEKLPDVIVPPCVLHANPATNMTITPRIKLFIAESPRHENSITACGSSTSESFAARCACSGGDDSPDAPLPGARRQRHRHVTLIVTVTSLCSDGNFRDPPNKRNGDLISRPNRCQPRRTNQSASGSGRIWNFTSFGGVPLPPSMWKGARVEMGV